MSAYNCRQIALKCPANFIPVNIGDGYKEKITMDACISYEVRDLWKKGIRTLGCCCGHGRLLGFIQVVEEDIPKMEDLGYQHYIYPDEFGGKERKDAFIPYCTKHIYDGYAERWKND